MTVPTTTKPVAPALAAETQGARRATEVSAASAGGAAAATPAAADGEKGQARVVFAG